MLEDEVDEKYYIKKTNNLVFTETRASWDNSGKGYGSQQDRAYYQDGLCPTLSNCNASGDKSQVVLADKTICLNSKDIQMIEMPQIVKIRKFEVDVNKLKETLKNHKNYTNKEIALILDVPLTTVEHWFRNDNCFSIPDQNIWYRLKTLLKINTNEFDKSITTFEEREGIYEKANRYYLDTGIAPTLTNASANEKIIVGGNNDSK
jgi:hypothetical protein